MAQAVRVEGLAGLLAAFAKADKTLRDDMRDALEEAASPVRAEAQRLAGTVIAHNRRTQVSDWTAMRTGIFKSVVYIAPVERGVKVRGNERLRREKFAPILLGKAMEPALDGRQEQVADRLDKLIDEVADVWERTPGDG